MMRRMVTAACAPDGVSAQSRVSHTPALRGTPHMESHPACDIESSAGTRPAQAAGVNHRR